MMMHYMFFLTVFGMLMSMVTLFLQYKHLLSILLSLEAMTMSLFGLLFFMSSNVLSNEMSLMFITMGACEASLGLAILVMVIRTEGNDYVSSFSSQKC